MVKDALGDRMKKYEYVTRTYLTPRMPVIIRLLKAKFIADELGLAENEHYGLIYDKCLTELEPEEDDGTTLAGIWFCPIRDEVAHSISKKYRLYS